jgi:arsenical pump membrane protein
MFMDTQASPLVAIAIFLFTLTGVIARPRGFGIGVSALTGAVLALATGVVTQASLAQVWGLLESATLALVALILLSLVLDEAGLFRALALYVVRWRDRLPVRALLSLLLLLEAAIAPLLTDLGTILLVVPFLVELLLVLGFGARSTLAFAFGAGAIADIASWSLPVGHWASRIHVRYFEIPLWEYVAIALPLVVFAVVASFGVLGFYFNYGSASTRAIPTVAIPQDWLDAPQRAIRDPLDNGWREFGQRLLKAMPWQAIGFTWGMYLVTAGLANVGLVDGMSHRLDQLSQWGFSLTAIGTGFLTTLLSAATNNLPTASIDASAIELSGVDGAIAQGMIYAGTIGCVIGAKLSPFGSISTLLWFYILKRKGITVRWKQYVRLSAIVVFPVLCIALLGLTVWLPLWVAPGGG